MTANCHWCEASIAARLPGPIADALAGAGIHIGNTTGGYTVEPTEADGIYRLTILVAAEYPDDVRRHERRVEEVSRDR